MKNIGRNKMFSLASIATMAACIFLFGIFFSVVTNFKTMVKTAEEGVAVTVFFEKGIEQDKIDEIGKEIKKRPEVRLFANMLAGHMAMLVLTCLIFISASMGPALNGTLTVASVLFNIFMNALELLVAFIQAYVFTMLSAVFIGLAQEGARVKTEE